MHAHTDTTYQGWTNWQTWNVSLWLSNDYGLYCASRDLASETDNLRDLADALEEMCSYSFGYVSPDGTVDTSRACTPDGAGIGDPTINWREIAQSFLED